jgi:uncharacterized protein (TIGR03083 family)
MSEQHDVAGRIVDLLTGVWQELSELCAGLTEPQWKTPSDLPAWSVQDVLAHVIGVERLLEGLPAADALPGKVRPHVRNPIGELNEREVAARRSRTGAEVLIEWDELRERRQRTIAAGDAEYFAQPMQTPAGPGTMTDFLAMRVLDCWLHEQDIRRALALPPTLAGPAADHTLDHLTAALPMVVGKRAACPEGAAVAIELTGPIERRYVCEVTNGRAALVKVTTAAPKAAIAMDTESYLLLAAGRRTPSELAARITVAGHTGLADRVLGGMNVMI